MHKYVIYFFCIIIIGTGCKDGDTTKQSLENNVDSAELLFQNRLKPIEENYQRINAISKWERIDSVDLHESIEGGEANYYYSGNKLEKIVAIYFGERAKWVNEYYLLNGQLSFVFEATEKYNRPFYQDSTAKKEGNDTEVFDPSKSEVEECRFYFENGVIIHNTNNQDCGAPDAREFVIEQQKRIITDYKKLISLLR
jgi:hypothetical protein